MNERIREELEFVRRRFGELEYSPASSSVVVKHLMLPVGWDREETELLFLIPSGYPVTPPDNFYTDNALRLSSGGEPGSSPKDQSQLGGLWRMFSWHLDDEWRPHADPTRGDNLVTFLLKCLDRLKELS